jgi:hypothetical protein
MKKEPLFVRFLNGETNTLEVINSFIELSEDKESKEIATKALDSVPDLSLFRRDFANCVEDIIDNGISRNIVNYMDSYLKPSLLEMTESGSYSKTNDKRWVTLKDDSAPWIEAVICYNLGLYIKAYGLSELKRCPVCNKFFSHKGRYAKYCSDVCKGTGGNKDNRYRPDYKALA